jgi:hypothetical protein
MNRILILCCGLLSISTLTSGQNNRQSEKVAIDNPLAEFSSVLSEAHQKMKVNVGEWKEEITIWESPSAKPTISRINCTINIILGGRYQLSNHQGDMGGFMFEGIGTMAYDMALNKYVSTWIDNMGTGMTVLEGTADNTGKVVRLNGFTTDPVKHTKTETREVITYENENAFKIEKFNSFQGREFKNMEIKFTR